MKRDAMSPIAYTRCVMTPRPISARTARLAAIDRAHLWHPFTAMRQWRESDPIIIDSAEGDELIDTEGRRYIDGVSSLWCNVHGHRVPEIDQAIRDQLDRVAHSTLLGLSSTPSIELADRLVRAARQLNAERRACDLPGRHALNKVFYSDAGATATELAIKMAIGFQHHTGCTDRKTIIAFSGAYHGDTVGAMSVGYSEMFHRPFESLTFRTVVAPAPDVTNAPESRDIDWPWHDESLRHEVRDRCLRQLDSVLDRHGDSTAAVMIEPLVQGAAGMVTHPRGFLAGVARRCAQRGLLLIADEVAVGLCRTGTFFACEQEGVVPDILCLAKGLSGGYLPLAATLCTDEIEEAFCGETWEHKTLYHGHTYTGNALGCAAALANLDLIEQRDTCARVRRHAECIAGALGTLRDHPNVGDVRQRGVMVGIDLVASRQPRRLFDPLARVGQTLCAAARPRGLIIRPLGDTVILNPMPGMKSDTLERMMQIVVQTIRTFDFAAVGG